MSKSSCTTNRQHVHKCHGVKALLSHNVKALQFLVGQQDTLNLKLKI